MASAPSANDRWASGAAYERYMGRWSRPLARAFVTWLAPAPSGHWLDVGCGTGALTAAVCALGAPASVVGCDPSPAFVEAARQGTPDAGASFVVAGADALPRREGGGGDGGGFDVIASALVLNFVPEPARALEAMRERVRPGGTVAACVWDYRGGLELLHHFWQEVVAADPAAAVLDEARRFDAWTTPALAALFAGTGLAQVQSGEIVIETAFADFDDYWNAFLGGTGPAPAYVASLDDARRERLRARLQGRLSGGPDGRVVLRARAIVARGDAG